MLVQEKVVRLTDHTFFLDKLDYAIDQYFVHILSHVTDNNPLWYVEVNSVWKSKF